MNSTVYHVQVHVDYSTPRFTCNVPREGVPATEQKPERGMRALTPKSLTPRITDPLYGCLGCEGVLSEYAGAVVLVLEDEHPELRCEALKVMSRILVGAGEACFGARDGELLMDLAIEDRAKEVRHRATYPAPALRDISNWH